jgi:hypothetical protein
LLTNLVKQVYTVHGHNPEIVRFGFRVLRLAMFDGHLANPIKDRTILEKVAGCAGWGAVHIRWFAELI